MKRVERINNIMRYINNHSQFNISELMNEFNISRSTALRDVKEIESMGRPLVSEVGRNGGYFILNNSFLPKMRFTENEVKALFIAFMATKNQQLPYLSSRQSLTEKLITLIPINQQEELILLNQLILFEGTYHHNPDLLNLSDFPHPILEKIIKILLNDRYLMININVNGIHSKLPIYLLHLYKEKNNWYIEGVNQLDYQVTSFMIDNIQDVTNFEPQKWLSYSQVISLIKEAPEPNIIIKLQLPSILQFKKYSPHKLTLHYLDPFQTQAVIRTYLEINTYDEIENLVNWILFLGESITIEKLPSKVEMMLEERCKRLASLEI